MKFNGENGAVYNSSSPWKPVLAAELKRRYGEDRCWQPAGHVESLAHGRLPLTLERYGATLKFRVIDERALIGPQYCEVERIQ